MKLALACNMLAVVGLAVADAPPVSAANGLIIYGPMGIMLVWFAWRAESKIETLTGHVKYLGHKIEGLTRAMLADVVGREGSTPAARKYAQDTLDEIMRDRERGEGTPFARRTARTPFVLPRDPSA